MPERPCVVVDTCLAIWACHVDRDPVVDATYAPWKVADLCLDLLCRLRSEGYHVAMSEDLRGEWQDQLFCQRDRTAVEHGRRQYARDWYMSLQRRGRIRGVDVSAHRLMGDHLSDVQRKDAHMVESALASDHRILSRDTSVRVEWEDACQAIPPPIIMLEEPSISRIMWGDPAVHGSRLLEWLTRGAPVDASLLLIGGGQADSGTVSKGDR